MDLKWTIVVFLLTSAILEVVSESGDKKRVWKKKKNRKKWKNRGKKLYSEMIESMATTIAPLIENNKPPNKVENKHGKSDEFPPKLK